MDPHDTASNDARARDALRIQAAAVAAQQAVLDEQESRLEGQAVKLGESTAQLRDERLRHNGEVLIARQRLKDAWEELRRARFRWKHRRGNERAALRVRAQDVEQAAAQLAHIRAQIQTERDQWLAVRDALDVEIDGLNQRAVNQRQALAKLQDASRLLAEQPKAEQPNSTEAVSAKPLADGAPVQAAITELEAYAGALADQRLLLIEAWERLAGLHVEWHTEREQVAAELETVGQRLYEQELCLQGREQICTQNEAVLGERHERLVRFHREIVAARARLRGDEEAWEHDKLRVLSECEHRETAAEQQSAALTELRERWLARRKQELQQLRAERQTLETWRIETAKLRQELTARAAQIEREQRVLTEKRLALEQFQQDLAIRTGDPAQTAQRLQRLRRQLIMRGSGAIRALQRHREALQGELRTLEERHESLRQRTASLEAAEAAFAETQINVEHGQVAADAEETSLEHELHRAETQRHLAERQALSLRDEMERIASSLLDEPEPPQQRPLAA